MMGRLRFGQVISVDDTELLASVNIDGAAITAPFPSNIANLAGGDTAWLVAVNRSFVIVGYYPVEET